MNKRILLSGVALIASLSFASAQGGREGGAAGSSDHRGSPSASSETRHGGVAESHENGAAGTAGIANQRQTEHHAQSAKGANGQAANEKGEHSTTGQGPEKHETAEGTASKTESRNDEHAAQRGRSSAEQGKNTERSKDQASSRSNGRSTAGQSSTDQNEARKSREGDSSSKQPKESDQSTAKSSNGDARNGASPSATAQGRPDGTQQSQTAPQQSTASIRSQAGATINAQQQTKIQQSVLSAHNAPRVNDVNFDIRTNAVVPSHVHVVGVSDFPVLVEAFPRYRDDSFFVAEDNIVIVDRSHRIVDVVPAGPNARIGRTSGSATTSAAIDLSEPEIRELQQVLIDRGYYHGRVDGEFGPEMREALVSFQRKEGFEATGRIDSRTVDALGLSGRVGQNGQSQGNQAAQPQNKNGQQASSPSSDRSQNKSAGETSPSDKRLNTGNQSTQSNKTPSTNGQSTTNKETNGSRAGTSEKGQTSK